MLAIKKKKKAGDVHTDFCGGTERKEQFSAWRRVGEEPKGFNGGII